MKRVIIVGGGKSVTAGIESGLWEKIQGQEIWSLNYTFKMMPYLPTRQIWVDTTFWKNNSQDMERLAQQGVLCHAKMNTRYLGIDYIKTHEVGRDLKEKNKIFSGAMGLCGMFALGLAIKEGYDEIYLLGYDWGTKSENDINTHFYQGKTTYISSGVGRPQVYLQGSSPKKGVHDFDIYKEHKTVYNVSVESNINTFPKLSFSQFYEQIKTEEKSIPIL